jgi:hypothetical protein
VWNLLHITHRVGSWVGHRTHMQVNSEEKIGSHRDSNPAPYSHAASRYTDCIIVIAVLLKLWNKSHTP